MNSTYLFVYGTLMRPFVSKMTQFLSDQSTFVGSAYMPGRLYDVGHYPGAIYDAKATTQVLGEVFQIWDTALIFKVLDAYEGIHPQHVQQNEYDRAKVAVRIQDEELHCWAYLYNLAIDGLIEIMGGDYLAYAQNNDQHQNFIRSV